jgi:MOSC domain-containing protein YiiM
MLDDDTTLADLRARFPCSGRVAWIGLRPGLRAAIRVVDSAQLIADAGIEGDHRAARGSGKRQVTLIQQEHLGAIAALAGLVAVDPALLRRNLVVSGISLAALRDRCFRIGEAVFEGTGDCQPCSRMEENLGPGGYNAMCGHGGITARVLQGGRVRIGDLVQPCQYSGNER